MEFKSGIFHQTLQFAVQSTCPDSLGCKRTGTAIELSQEHPDQISFRCSERMLQNRSQRTHPPKILHDTTSCHSFLVSRHRVHCACPMSAQRDRAAIECSGVLELRHESPAVLPGAQQTAALARHRRTRSDRRAVALAYAALRGNTLVVLANARALHCLPSTEPVHLMLF